MNLQPVTSVPVEPAAAPGLLGSRSAGLAFRPGQTPFARPAGPERRPSSEGRVQALAEEVDPRTGRRLLGGRSPKWRKVLHHVAQVASTDATVLLLGESGTGKEVVARLLHRASQRQRAPFVAINCAALPEQLFEAELFGYERGAFTSAVQSKPGMLEQAAGGTLFLDEVGELTPTAQAKLLRVLQEREFQRLGGTRFIQSRARIVAATNRDLLKRIAGGQFREDLYYRLNVFAIRLPSLRERPEDILPIGELLLESIGATLPAPPLGLSHQARQALVEYSWPGNVRELRNMLERAAILSDGGLITCEHLDLLTLAPAAPVCSLPHSRLAAADEGVDALLARRDLQSVERQMIESALWQARFNKSKAAAALGLTRHQLYIRLQRHGLL